jgi:RHH-type proline utilization regulon transcriptional repressor/proline dehydrogenase/delta 1-pyrroline-5-carboxylate dehydrogenase
VIDYVDGLGAALNRRLMVRLVKGAYWDTEIKRAQERGLDDYPVFTRKAMTDLNYIACAQKLLALRPRIFPQFATHNALTVATVIELPAAKADSNFSGCTAWARRSTRNCARSPAWPAGPMRRSAATAISWPIWCGGCWRTAPIRRSWRSPPTTTCRSRRCCAPGRIIGIADHARHPNIPLPRDLYQPQRRGARGIEFGERAA